MVPRQPPRPGGKISAADLARQYTEVRRVAGLTASPPLEVVRQGTGLHLRWAGEESFWAAVTDRLIYTAADGWTSSESGDVPDDPPAAPLASDVYYYAWQRVTVDAAGDPAATDPPFTGGVADVAGALTLVLPALEVNGATVMPGRVVRLFKGVSDGGEHFLFAVSGGDAAEPTSFDIPWSWQIVDNGDGTCSVQIATVKTFTGQGSLGEEHAP